MLNFSISSWVMGSYWANWLPAVETSWAVTASTTS